MNAATLVTVLSEVDCPCLFVVDDTGGWLQACCTATNETTGAREVQYGRKWLLDDGMTRSDVVRTAFLAGLTLLEHEWREAFTYRGVPVFGPHFDLDLLASLGGSKSPR